MPTRKQKRRAAKEKRHEYEFVYVDDEGNELDEVPEELAPAKAREERRNGAKPAATKKPAARGRGPRRTPQPPSWQRASKRAVLLGIVVFALFSFSVKKGHGYTSALVPAVIYTALFIPFTYALDRFAYRRWQARDGGGSPPAKKR